MYYGDAGMLCGVSVRVGVSVEFVAMNRAMLNRQSVKESRVTIDPAGTWLS